MTLSHVLLGMATGVPVMIVVGPVSLLLIEQGMRHGFRGGIPAAVGVGATDLTFSVAAAAAGAAAARVLEPAQAVLHYVAFGVLAWLAAVTWRSARRDLLHVVCQAVPASPAVVGSPAGEQAFALADAGDAYGAGPVPTDGGGSGVRPLRGVVLGGDGWFGRAAAFFAITAANPITIVVFASLVLSGREGIGSPGWVLGMTLASALVSTVYLAVGHGLGALLSESATARLRMGGAVVIAGLGAWFALAG